MATLDFKKLLRKYADGQHFDAETADAVDMLPAPSNAAPEVELTPSQQAVQGFTEGISAPPASITPVQTDPSAMNSSPIVSRETPAMPSQEAVITNPQPMALSASDPESVRPRYVDEPTPYDKAKRDVQFFRDQPIKKEKLWKDILAKTITGANAFFNPDPSNRIEGFGKVKRDNAVRDAEARLAPLEKQRQTDQAFEFNQAKINDIPIDNELKRQQIENQRLAKQEQVKASTLNKLSALKHFDPKNAAHASLAKQAGLNPDDLKGWDDRNPIEKTVAGVSYRLNRDSGQYEPTNLPADETKTLTDYEVEMPNGEKRKYRVSQRDAASFSTQMTALGARLEATATENAKSREFQSSENEKNRQQRQQQFLMNFQQKTANDLRAIAGDLQKAAEYKTNKILQIQKDLKADKIDKETADSMIAALQ